MKEPKYKVGDVVQFTYQDGTKSIFTIEDLRKDENCGYIYYDYTHHTLLCEHEIDGVLSEDSELYKRYQLYLELKKEFE